MRPEAEKLITFSFAGGPICDMEECERGVRTSPNASGETASAMNLDRLGDSEFASHLVMNVARLEGWRIRSGHFFFANSQ